MKKGREDFFSLHLFKQEENIKRRRQKGRKGKGRSEERKKKGKAEGGRKEEFVAVLNMILFIKIPFSKNKRQSSLPITNHKIKVTCASV